MNLRELEAQAEALAPVIKMAVSQATGPLLAELKELRLANEELSRRLDEMPDLDALAAITPSPVDLEALALAAAALVPPAAPGKDAAPVDLAAVAALVPVDLEAIAKLVVVPEPDLGAIAALVVLPEPIPGKDAEPVDLAAVAALVQLPEPIPGRDAEPVDLEALAAAAAALIPAPAAGKDAEPVDLAAVAALVQVPQPEPVDLAAVAALVTIPQLEPIDVDAIARAAAALVPPVTAPPAEHGRDALDLEILPAIDESKQYARGTYAAHRGGLWKSYERTHGMRGWECIVDGIDGVTVTQDSVREFSVTLSKSSGTSAVQKFSLPVQVYKGVHRDGEEYQAHDTVTWGGSVWACKSATTDKPGASEAWVLAVKAGRAGKDLRENASQFDASKGVRL